MLVSQPLKAQVNFNTARRMHYEGQWDMAQRAYSAAIDLNPIVSTYFLGYGDFLWDHAYSSGQTADLASIEALYAKAAYVNPECIECWVKIGQIQFAHQHINLGMENLLYALQLDPYGSDTMFAVKETCKAIINTDFTKLDKFIHLTRNYAFTRRGKREIDIVFKQKQRSPIEINRYEHFLAEYEQKNKENIN